MPQPLIIMGIDPGYDRIGWAVGKIHGSQVQAVSYGLIQTHASESLIQRYQLIDQELSQIISHFQPSEVAIESLFFNKNTSTAIHVAEARGVIISAFFRQKVAVFEYTPLQIKQAVTGFGRADKKAVEKMVLLQLKKCLNEKSPKLVDDTFDALAVLLTHSASRSTFLS